MTRQKISIRPAALLGAALLIAPAALTGQEQQYHFFADLGVQGTSIDGDSTKFEEYREVPDGFILRDASFGWLSPGTGWAFGLTARDVGEDDEETGLTIDRPGTVRFRAGWNRIPHRFSRSAVAIHSIQGGRFDLPATWRAVTEANPLLIRDLIAQAGRRLEIGYDREIATAAVDVDLTPGWNAGVGYRHEERAGNQRFSVGTYSRVQGAGPGTGAGTFDRERFVSSGIELPLTVDSRTSDYEISTSFHRKVGFVNLGWQGSAYQNHIDTLFWDNPFEAPPSVSSATDRGRFARGAADLWPDNTWQRLSASGGVNLPGRTRINATWAQATMKQDAELLPFTQNEALFFPGPDGVVGTADDIRGTTLSLLPAASLDGEVTTTRGDLGVSSHPVDPLTLRASYRLYEYEDESRHLVFPGYAAFGESAWRVGIGQRLNGVERLFNEPGGYERTVWRVGAGWRFGHPARLDVEYTNTEWDYEKRQVDATNEDTFEARLFLTPAEWIEARLTWLDASRDFDGPYTVGLETSRIRQFDIWNRDRTRLGAEIDLQAGEHWTFGLAWFDWQDEYPGAVPEPSPLPAANPFPSLPYGLNEAQNDSLSLTVTYSGESWLLAGSVGRDTSLWDSLAVTKTTLANDSVQFDPRNRWRRVQDDTLDWANLGFESELVPDKVRLLADVSWSDYEGVQQTSNPDTPNVNSGVAYDFPSFSTDLFSGNLALRWVVTANAELEARYVYEPFQLDDFMWDVMQPYMQGIIQETGGTPSQIRDADVRRFLFLDSTYTDYTAHVWSLALRLTY